MLFPFPRRSRRPVVTALACIFLFAVGVSAQSATTPGAAEASPPVAQPASDTAPSENTTAPTAAPAATPAAGPAPAIYDRSLIRLPRFLVAGREDELIGIADSATQGTIGSAELANRPLLRTGEVLETIPGVIITQHAGGGKANQYFTRGFNLDHGTDFAVDLDGVPVNLPSHAHGQGYADLNILIPELLDRIDYEKGPYYAANSDFSTVGAAHLVLSDSLPDNIFKAEGGTDHYSRILLAGSTASASGNLLYGFEAYHEDGPWVVPDQYTRYNGVLKYSAGSPASGYSIAAMVYHGDWNSTDQVAASAVQSGLIPFYGSQDPSDGGYSQRVSLQAEWHGQSAASSTQVLAYVYHYDLNLFSNFDYFLDSPMGDQFEQQDNRTAGGIQANHVIHSRIFGHDVSHTLGLQVQTSGIDTGLYQTIRRVRHDKLDYDGNIIPAATRVDAITETSAGIYYDNQIHWSERFRSELGIRESFADDHVRDRDPRNSGKRSAALTSPKLNLVFGPWDKTELYIQGGNGFHSNDARAVTSTVDPDGSSIGGRPGVLIPARGAEVGVRTTAISKLQSTLSIWYLHSNSELYFNGFDADAGETTPSAQSSHRYGVEFANYYTPVPGLTLDLDYADSWAYFNAPTTASQDVTPGGTRIDEAIRQSLAAGATIEAGRGWEASLRLRYFGPRPLTSDGSIKSASTLIVNLGMGYKINRRWRLTCDVLNLLNRHDHDIDYYYQSRNVPRADAPAPNEDHFHPVEPIEVRFGVEARL